MLTVDARPLKPEEMAVLYIHVKDPGLAFSLAAVEKRMGPKGLRSPAPEAHAYLVEQGLLAPALGLNGQPLSGKFTFSPAGEQVLGQSLRATLTQLDRAVERARAAGIRQEVDRLEALRELMPPIEMATSGGLAEADSEETDDEPVGTAGAILGRKPVTAAVKPAKADDAPKKTVGPAALKGRKGAPKPPPRRAAASQA